MPISPSSFRSLLAAVLIPGTLREAGATTPDDVEDFFASRLCSQLCDYETGMWQLGCATLAQAWKMEREGLDYQEPRPLSELLPGGVL